MTMLQRCLFQCLLFVWVSAAASYVLVSEVCYISAFALHSFLHVVFYYALYEHVIMFELCLQCMYAEVQ